MKKLEKSLADSIQLIKDSRYKGTAIKVELEANLRRSSDSDGYCDICENDGYYYCDECNDGIVEVWNDETNETENVSCDNCDGQGRIDCTDCPSSDSDDFDSVNYCKEWLENHVSAAAKSALVYSKFYNDGSVDSEYTFTVMLDNAKFIPEFIKSFKQLADRIGNGLDVDGAGMHVAILNSPTGNYPGGNSVVSTYARNFADSMSHLLPALYFLGSSDHRSRALNYRLPRIGLRDKYNAITAHQGVFEYRVFETCYDRPEAIFDYIAVIAKTLKFYSRKQVKLDWFGKIGEVDFREGRGLERFYYTNTHLKALKAGLRELKPDHKTIEQLFKERNFKVTSQKLRADQKERAARYRIDWPEVKERTEYAYKAARLNAKARYLRMLSEESRSYVESRHGSLEDYIKDELENFRQPRTLAQYIAERAQRDVRGGSVQGTVIV